MEVTEDEISGCAEVDVSCLGAGIVEPIQLGCFADGGVARQCFAGCQDDCNFNGICINGMCDCGANFFGPTCLPVGDICPNNCGGELRGTCNLETQSCECNQGFSGDDCSNFDNTEFSQSSNGGLIAAIVVPTLFVCLVLAGLAAFLGIRGYRKYQEKKRLSAAHRLEDQSYTTTEE